MLSLTRAADGHRREALLGDYKPTAYQAHRGTYWSDRKIKPADFQLE